MKWLISILILLNAIFFFSCEEDEITHEPPVTEIDELKDSACYIVQVLDYQYAPGQYATNTALTNSEYFVGKPHYLYTVYPDNPKSAVSLGGFGGYIIGKFNHTIPNLEGNDLIVFCGNSPAAEPGIVSVMEDTNGNGLPDDTWHELSGSAHNHSETYTQYQITYYKPALNENITWKDNKGNSDTLRVGFGSTTSYAWWPDNTKDSLLFTGTRLPDAYYNNSTGTTESWVVYPNRFNYGYAENNAAGDYNETKKGNEFDIANARDSVGNPVTLSGIRFIKIHTAVLQQAGWLNEISTEVYGAADLRMLNE